MGLLQNPKDPSWLATNYTITASSPIFPPPPPHACIGIDVCVCVCMHVLLVSVVRYMYCIYIYAIYGLPFCSLNGVFDEQ